MCMDKTYCTEQRNHIDNRVSSSPTLDALGLVGTLHVLQDVVVEGMGQLCRHGFVKVWLVTFQYALQCELAHTQHLKVHVHDTFAPRSAALLREQPQVQDLVYTGYTQGKAARTLTAAIVLIDFFMLYSINVEHFLKYTASL